ncbi:MAG: hypothetical protein RL071_4858 [Pseudomonadota bacterium]|jgi:GT2 family glycosyltransferase
MRPSPVDLRAEPDWNDHQQVDLALRIASGAWGGRARLLLRAPAAQLAQARALSLALLRRRFPLGALDQLPVAVLPLEVPPPASALPLALRPGAPGLADPAAVAAALPPAAPPGFVSEAGIDGAPNPQISVLVATFGRPIALVGLLDALAAQQGRGGAPSPDFEVILVDDGTAPPIHAQLELARWALPLRLLRQENAGPAAARNLGLAWVRAPIVLLLNDDAVPSPTLVADHLTAHAAAPVPAMQMGTFTLIPSRRRDQFAALVESTRLLFPQPLLPPGRCPGQVLCSGNASLPTAPLRAVGGFDPAIRAPGGEDTELGRRLEQVEGLGLVYDPGLVCGHDHLLSCAGLAARKRHLGRTVVYLAERFGDLGMLLPGGPPVDELFDLRLERGIKRLNLDMDAVADTLDAACAAERETGSAPIPAARFGALVDDLSEAAYLGGLLEGRRARAARR